MDHHLFRIIHIWYGHFGVGLLWFFRTRSISRFGFLILKSYEYYEKIEMVLTMGKSSFFTNYWLLTGFHWIHVLVGLIILIFIRRSIQKSKTEASLEDIEASATFWHMCDIIWLLLYPVLYLLF